MIAFLLPEKPFVMAKPVMDTLKFHLHESHGQESI